MVASLSKFGSKNLSLLYFNDNVSKLALEYILTEIDKHSQI